MTGRSQGPTVVSGKQFREFYDDEGHWSGAIIGEVDPIIVIDGRKVNYESENAYALAKGAKHVSVLGGQLEDHHAHATVQSLLDAWLSKRSERTLAITFPMSVKDSEIAKAIKSLGGKLV